MWREVPGYPKYVVSDDGQLGKTGDGGVRILRMQKDAHGYLRITAYVEGRKVPLHLHRALGLAFLPNPEGLPAVRHLNDVPDDNRLGNLLWGTYRSNTADRIRNGRDHLTEAAKEMTHCKSGLHERIPENVAIRNRRDGRVITTCILCERARNTRRRNA